MIRGKVVGEELPDDELTFYQVTGRLKSLLIEKEKDKCREAIAALKVLYNARIEEKKARCSRIESNMNVRKIRNKVSSLETKKKKLELAIKISKASLKNHRKECKEGTPYSKELKNKMSGAMRKVTKLYFRNGYRDSLSEEEKSIFYGLASYEEYLKKGGKK